MKNRSPFAVFIFSLLTLGIYSIYWLVVTKGEMNQRGAKIPTAWLIIVPFVSIWWMWKYSEGVGQITDEKISGVLAFVMLWLISFIGMAIIQDAFNKLSEAPVVAATAASPNSDVTATEPVESSTTPAEEMPEISPDQSPTAETPSSSEDTQKPQPPIVQ